MADLSSLMRIAPTAGAAMVGAQHRSEQEAAAMKQMELEQLIKQRMAQEQRMSAKHPFELEQMGLANQTTRAALPGVGATAESLMLDAEKKRATQETGIAAANFENTTKVRTGALGQLEALSAEVERAPGVQRHLVLNEAFKRLGAPPEAAQGLMQIFNNVPAEQLPQFMKQLNAQLLRNNPEYARTMDQENLQQSGATQRQGMANASAEKIAKMKEDQKRRDVEDIQQQLKTMISKAGAKGARALHSALTYAETVALRNQMPEQAAMYAEAADRIRPQAEAEISNTAPRPGEIDVGGVAGMPTNPNRSIAPRGPQAPAPQPSNGRVRVISPDGKVGSVPASQLQEALKQGFKKQ